MSGDIDGLYVRARRVLLDVLEALRDQLDAVILVGAQAIYLHAGEANLTVAPFTTDADLALDPRALLSDPKLADAMAAGGFIPSPNVNMIGTWISRREGVEVDLMVPEAVGGAGRRAARLGLHGNQVARKTRGLEAALADKRVLVIASLEGADSRRFEIAVAGPAALLIAKLHKLEERHQDAGRRSDKDALDVYRLLVATTDEDLARAFQLLLTDPIAGEVTRQALGYLGTLFGLPEANGSQMAARAAYPLMDFAEVAASCAVLAQELLEQVQV